MSGKLEDVLKEGAGDFGIAVVADLILRFIFRELGGKVAEHVHDKYVAMDTLRAELGKDLAEMPLKSKEHLLRRLAKAKKTPGEEDRIVASLCKLLGLFPKENAKGRKKLLRILNDRTDREFTIVVYAVENDRLSQYIGKFLRGGNEVGRLALYELGTAANNAAGRATPFVRKLRERIEGKGGAI